MNIGWLANVFILLTNSDNPPLPSGPVQINELAWVSSILGIGGLVGTVAMAWLTECFGRKHSLIALALPQIVSFVLIIYAQNVYYLYLSRFFTGFCGGAMFVNIPLTVTEIAEDR